ELIAIGAANVGAGFSQAFAVDGSLSRTAAGDGAGAQSQVSNLVCAVLIIVTVLVLTPLFENLPEAALAAIVIGAVWHLIDLRKLTRLWSLGRVEFWAGAICMLGVLTFGILEGVLIAVGFSLVALIYRATRPSMVVLGAGDERYRDIDRAPDAETDPGVVVLRFDYELYFANASYFREEVRRIVRETEPRPYALVLDCEGIPNLDLTAAETLDELRQELDEQGITVWMARVKGPVRDMLQLVRREEDLHTGALYPTVDAAVEAAKNARREAR
ncbi:MAG: SulP family inorganic anion transporter, partial [Solirubrobacterales bacterium]